MTHGDVIKQILSAEQQAKQIVEEAEIKRANLETDLEESIQRIHSEIEQNVQNRIEAFREETDARLSRELKKLDESLTSSLERLEKLCQSKETSWINSLLSVVIENA